MAFGNSKDLTIVVKARNDAKKELSGLNRQLKGLSGVISVASKALAGMAIVAGVGLFAGAIKESAGFEQALSNVSAVTKATAEEQKRLKDAALEMGSKSVFSASQAAKAQLYLGQSGQDTGQIIDSLAGVMSLAAATSADLGFAAEVTTSTLSQFGLEAEDSARVANVFAASAAASQANIDKLAFAMRQAGPVANSLGLSLEETTGTLNLLFNAGFKGEQAGTILRGVLTRLAKPTTEAADLLKELGVNVNDSSGKMLPFIEIIKQLEAASINTSEAITLFGQEAGPGLLTLLQAGSKSLEEMIEKITDTDEAVRQAEERTKNFKGAVTKLKSAVETVSIIIGDQFTPALTEAAKALAGMITAGTDAYMINKNLGMDTMKNRAFALNQEIAVLSERIDRLKKHKNSQLLFVGSVPKGTIDLLDKLIKKRKEVEAVYKKTTEVMINEQRKLRKTAEDASLGGMNDSHIKVFEKMRALHLEKFKELSDDYKKNINSFMSVRSDSISQNLRKSLKAISDPLYTSRKTSSIFNPSVVEAYKKSLQNGEKAVLTMRQSTDGLVLSLRDASSGYGRLSFAMSETEVKVNDIKSALLAHQDQLDSQFNGPIKIQSDYIRKLKETGGTITELTEAENRLREIQASRIKESIVLQEAAVETLKELRKGNLADIEANNKKIQSLEQSRADIAQSLEGINIRRREAGLKAEEKRANALLRLQREMNQAVLLGGPGQADVMGRIARDAEALSFSAKEGSVQFLKALTIAEDAFKKLDAIKNLSILKSKAKGAGLDNDAEILKTALVSAGEAIDGYTEKIKMLESLIASSELSIVVDALDNATGPGREIRNELEGLFKDPITQTIKIEKIDSFAGISSGGGGSISDWQWGSGKAVSSFAVGTRYVPENMLAYLHKGETVLTRGEASGGQSWQGETSTVNFLGDIVVKVANSSEAPHELAKKIKFELDKIKDMERG